MKGYSFLDLDMQNPGYFGHSTCQHKIQKKSVPDISKQYQNPLRQNKLHKKNIIEKTSLYLKTQIKTFPGHSLSLIKYIILKDFNKSKKNIKNPKYLKKE